MKIYGIQNHQKREQKQTSFRAGEVQLKNLESLSKKSAQILQNAMSDFYKIGDENTHIHIRGFDFFKKEIHVQVGTKVQQIKAESKTIIGKLTNRVFPKKQLEDIRWVTPEKMNEPRSENEAIEFVIKAVNDAPYKHRAEKQF